MNNEDIHARLNQVMRSLFDDSALMVSRVTTAKDVEGWDSLTHINLIVAVEREFKIRFATSEVQSMKKVGDLMDFIAKKTA